MRVVFASINERLTNGQIIASWTKKYWVQNIILVDDELVHHDFTKEILLLSVPKDVTAEVRSVIDTLEVIEKDTTNKSTMLLFEDLRCVLRLVNYGYKLRELNIGNIGSAQGRKFVMKDIYMSDEQKDILWKLQQKGVFVYAQKLPQDARTDIMKKLREEG